MVILTIRTSEMHKFEKMLGSGKNKMGIGDRKRCAVPNQGPLIDVQTAVLRQAKN